MTADVTHARPHRPLLRCLTIACCAVVLIGCATTPPPPTTTGSGLAGRPAPFRSAPGDLRVMVFNLRVAFAPDMGNHWDHRKDLALDTIRAFDPDILCTQEVSLGQADDLFEALRYDYRFVGVGRDDGSLDGEMCTVFVRRNRFTYRGEAHHWLSETPDVPGSTSWGTSIPRLVTVVRLRDRATDRTFFVFNTHFSAWSAKARERSAVLLRDLIEQTAGDAPVIVAGDFNAGEGSKPYRTLMQTRTAGGTLRDTYRDAHPVPTRGEGTKHNFRGRLQRRGARIDWVLASPAFDTVHAAIDRSNLAGRYPSDHFPVHAVLRWRAAE